MWECPDLYPLDGTWILSFSPQGLPARKYTFQNVQQSGYIILGKHLSADNKSTLSMEQTVYPTSIIPNPSARFIEWDMGFDFYAPQAFEDESGRRILIAWMGLSDKAYGNPTVSDGWQHTLTIPRQLTLAPDGQHILQQPLPEMEALRSCPIPVHHVHNNMGNPPFPDNNDAGINADVTPDTQVLETEGSFELLLSCPEAASFSVCLDKGLVFRFDHNTACCCLSFLPDHLCSANDAKGYGRTRRLAKLNKGDYIRNARIFVDHSSIEIFLNDGMLVFSSRYYKQGHDHKVILRGMLRAWAYSLRGFEVSKSDEPL
jgi:beta-fructofuranosidase